MNRWIMIMGPLLALVLFTALLGQGWERAPAITAAVTLWCAIWWIFEPIPIPFTSMLPLALFPLLGVLDATQVAHAYGNSLVLLLLGGFMIAEALAESGAHRRMALMMVNLFGGNSARALVLGFMAASALLSMWISNTATTLMLLPVALAILAHAQKNLAVPLLLGIAYAASIGGIGTPIGTPPNLIFMQVYADNFGVSPNFTQWMSWGLPVVVLMVPVAGLWLTRGLKLESPVNLPVVGAWQPAEKRVVWMFAITALLWMTRKEPWGGWSGWLNLPGANDAAVAMLSVVAMAVTPNGKGARLLTWDAARKIPWGVLILFGGGIAIASAFVESGLADHIAQQLNGLAKLPVWLIILAICLAVTFLTEVTSNTATSTLLMPMLAAASVVMGVDPTLLMVPAAMSASCAFMLPVATPPNAVVFGSQQVTIKAMARAGLVLNLAGALIITLVIWLRIA